MSVIDNEVLEWQGATHLVVADVDWGTFRKRTGGDPDSEEAKWGPGGMQPARARGGRRTRANITLTRAYDPFRDGPLFRQFEARLGRARAVVTDLIMDLDGNVIETISYGGMLKSLNRGDYDDASNDQRTFTVEVSTDA